MTTITDHHQRQQALDPNQSFAVSAPAGSGKTELLTQRVLKLLAQVDKPEEILCLTFTRKAAGEMTQRIIAALQLAREDIPPEQPHAYQTWQLAREALQQDAKKNWQLLQSPNRLRIQTIDGFCRNLAQQLSLESGLNTTSEPLDQPAPHYREAASEFLLNQLNRNGYLGDAVGTLLQHLDNNLNKLEQLLIGLLEKREQWLQHLISARDARPYLEQFLQQTIQETLETLAAQLQPVASDLGEALAARRPELRERRGQPLLPRAQRAELVFLLAQLPRPLLLGVARGERLAMGRYQAIRRRFRR